MSFRLVSVCDVHCQLFADSHTFISSCRLNPHNNLVEAKARPKRSSPFAQSAVSPIDAFVAVPPMTSDELHTTIEDGASRARELFRKIKYFAEHGIFEAAPSASSCPIPSCERPNSAASDVVDPDDVDERDRQALHEVANFTRHNAAPKLSVSPTFEACCVPISLF